MILLYSLLVLFFIAVAIDLLHGYRLGLTARYGEDGLAARVLILPPLLRVEIQTEQSAPYLLIFLFGMRIVKKKIVRKRKPGGAANGLRLARSASVHDVDIDAEFGMQDPFLTGIACAAVGAAAGLLPVEKAGQITVKPDFLSVSPHLSVDAHATVRFGQTILNYIRNK